MSAVTTSCQRCDWTYQAVEGARGPMIVLYEHHWRWHTLRCPFCGSVMVGRLCPRCDATGQA